jgi:hypothetical protein
MIVKLYKNITITVIMLRVFHLYNNNRVFKAGVLIGSGFAFMIGGALMATIGCYIMIMVLKNNK